jgi:putative component of toxin-antitoxin plasmid stabilization module
VTDEAVPKQVIVYAKDSGKEPFTEWLYSLRDVMGRKRILDRVSRLQQGNYGDCEPVGEGVSELRLFFGLATGFISVNRITASLSCFVAATKEVKAKTLNRRKPIGRSI